jgi:5-methylcytosine-specific restriction endonuclease McrA
MGTFKSIVTATWKIEEDGNAEHCLEIARKQLDDILISPNRLDGFTVQIDLVPMRTRKRLMHIKSFPVDEIIALITDEEERRDFIVDGNTYSIRMNSDRYLLFRQSRCCAACGIEGTKMILDLSPGDYSSPHFNLYAEENGKLLLMTKDHIIPKSRNGSDEMSNFVTMCHSCNNLKGNFEVTYEQIKELRLLYANPAKLPRRELRQLINTTRENMVAANKDL